MSSNLKNIEEKFEKLTNEQVEVFAEYLIESLGGRGIFEDGGPDEIEISISQPNNQNDEEN